MIECQPGKQSKTNFEQTGTCFNHSELISIAREAGISHAASLHPKKLGKIVRDIMYGKSDSVTRPKKPSEWITNEFKWLNSIDILAVMKQYEKSYKHFRFAGVFPRDFAILKDENGNCVIQDMCSYDASIVFSKKQINQIGIIINLDAYGGRGSHWVALMIEYGNRKGIYYYDSTAEPPHKDILVFIQKMRNLISKRFKKSLDIEFNRVPRQKKNTECGVYAMAFLALMLETKMSFSDICYFLPDDTDIHKLRDVFYVSL